MQPLAFDSTSFLCGGQRLFLVSGEIHYFRLPATQWRDRLEKLKAAGGNCVATYVPWLLHEPAEGSFAFGGQLDVEEFLRLCNEVGLWAIVRPGPYQYSELAYDGLPGWLCENYPQIRARRADGGEFRVSSVSYTHPLFLEKARCWYDQVIPRLARHQVTRGGAVAAAQFDNELIGIHQWFGGGWDYNPEAMGLGQESGRWPDFLRQRYGTLDAVNAAYGLDAQTLAHVVPVGSLRAATPGERRRMRDYQECYLASIADYARTLVNWMRGGGIDVPVVHNSAGPTMNALFQPVVDRLGEGFLLGSDHYYNLDLNWEQNNPTPKYAANCFYSLDMLRAMGMPPTVFEMPGGSASDWPPFTPHDAACAYMANVALGAKGYNFYVFAGGFNPPGSGVTGAIYDYGAAVSPTGDIRPLYHVQRELARFLNEHAWLASAQRMADCHIGFVWEHTRSSQYAGDRRGLAFSNEDAWLFLRRGLLLTSLCASLSPNLIDLSSDELLRRTDKPLMVAGATSLAQDIQQRLIKFVEAGGRLLIAPVVPTLDEHFEPCTLLADYLGVEQKPYPAMAPLLTAFDVPNVYVNGGLFALGRHPGGATPTATEMRGRSALIGCQHEMRRRGETAGGIASILGFHWQQARREHEQMLHGALSSLGLQQCVRCDNPNVWTSLRSDGQRSMLFLMNLFTAPMSVRVSYRDPASGQWIDTGAHELPGISVRAWSEGKVVR